MDQKKPSTASFLLGSLAGPLVLAGLTLFAFASSAQGYFVSDDLLHMHYLWRAFNGEPSLLLAPFYSPWLKDVSFYNFYRPLTELSFAFDYLLYKTHAAGFHITSMLWHLANVFLFCNLIESLLDLPAFYLAGRRERKITAFISAALWAVYPTHVEAVSWIAARSDLLATFFYLLTMRLFVLEQKGKIPTHKLWALPMVPGCLCKELIVSLPFTLFMLSWFINQKKSATFNNTFKKSLGETLPAFTILALYIGGRALAIGDLIGGYAGSTGAALNSSLANRWLYSQSLFKIFHPFNDQLIGQDSPLRLLLRVIWGLCGVMTIVSARLGGAIATKYRLILFAFAWLVLTLLPNLQVWSFSSTMAGGRIAYLPTMPIALLIVFSVYPIGVSALAHNLGIWVKLFALLVLGALASTMTAIARIDNIVWLSAARATHQIGTQLGAIVESTLASKARLVVLNLPAHVNGAFAFTNPGMAQILLQPPFSDNDRASALTVLDDQPCSYPTVVLQDVKAAATRGDLYRFYYYDAELKQLQPLAAKSFEDARFNREKFISKISKPESLPQVKTLSHDFEVDGENFVLALTPPLNPGDGEYLELTLCTSPQALFDRKVGAAKSAKICYLWNNCPADGDGEKQVYSVKSIDLGPPNSTAKYLIHLGENKLWLLSHGISNLQVYLPFFKDAKSTLTARFLPGCAVAPVVRAAVTDESAADALLLHKALKRGQTLTLKIDATALEASQKKSIKIELLPAYHYFDHYDRRLSTPQLNKKHLKTFDIDGLSGTLCLGEEDFPGSGTYQMRAVTVDSAGTIIGQFSQPITVDVSK